MALTDNIVAYWKLESNSNDSVASYNGTDTNVTYITGKIGNGANITGTGGDGISVADNTVFDVNNAKTVSCWIKFDTQTSNDIIIGKYGDFASADNYKNGWFFQAVNGSGIRASVYNDTPTGYVTSYSTMPSTGVWTHMVMTFNGSTELKLFVNGSQVGSTITTAGTFSFNNTSNLWFGKSSGDPFDGMVDEIGIWSRTLSDAEITSLYNGGNGLTYPFLVTDTTNFFNLMY